MLWKDSYSTPTKTIDLSSSDITLNSLPAKNTADIHIFVNGLVRNLVQTEQKANRIFEDEQCTKPKSDSDFLSLVDFSYKKIIQSWQYLLFQYGISIPIPSLTISEKDSGIDQKLTGMCYDVHTDSIQVGSNFLEYLRDNIYDGAEDFSLFYAIAHEVGHHMQKHIFRSFTAEYTHNGVTQYRNIDDMLNLRIFSILHHFDSSHQAEQIVELHADYLAGVIVHHANRIEPFLHKNDLGEGLATALLIGDDLMQLRKQGFISPETFSHGRCDQRALAFAKGFETGDPFLYTLEDIFQIFFQEGIQKPEEQSVTIF